MDTMGVPDLNDCRLSLTVGGQSWHRSGFATLGDGAAIFGEAAQQQAGHCDKIMIAVAGDKLSLEGVDDTLTVITLMTDKEWS